MAHFLVIANPNLAKFPSVLAIRTVKRPSADRFDPEKTRRNSDGFSSRACRGKPVEPGTTFDGGAFPAVRGRGLFRESGVPGPSNGGIEALCGRCGWPFEPGIRECARV